MIRKSLIIGIENLFETVLVLVGFESGTMYVKMKEMRLFCFIFKHCSLG